MFRAENFFIATDAPIWAHCYKTFFVRNLRVFVIS